jgi:hypothetical protein
MNMTGMTKEAIKGMERFDAIHDDPYSRNHELTEAAILSGIAVSVYVPYTCYDGTYVTTGKTAFNWSRIPTDARNAVTHDIVWGLTVSMSYGYEVA